MINATWITLAVVAVIGVTKLLTYLLGDKRKIRQLEKEILEKEKEYAEALAKNQTILLTIVDRELRLLRQALASIKKR